MRRGLSISSRSDIEEMPTRRKRKKDSGAGSDHADSPLSTSPFAWDGISFQVPENWHLAIHQYPKKVTRKISGMGKLIKK